MSKLLEAKNLAIILAIVFAVLFVAFSFVNLIGAVVMLTLSVVTIIVGVSSYGDLEE